VGAALTVQSTGLAFGPGSELPPQLGLSHDPGGIRDPGVVVRFDVDGVGQAAALLRPWWPHDGWVPEVDDDQLAALRRLRAAFGFRREDDRLEGHRAAWRRGGEDGGPEADYP
jgi:hypothetical protein